MENLKQIVASFIIVIIVAGFIVIPHKISGQTPQANLTSSPSSMNSTSPELALPPLLKHTSIISVLTINPWPTVKQNQNVNISGKLIDGFTFRPIVAEQITFQATFWSKTLPPARTAINIGPVTTGSDGNFNASISAPKEEGLVNIIAFFKGSNNYYQTLSIPSSVTVIK